MGWCSITYNRDFCIVLYGVSSTLSMFNIINFISSILSLFTYYILCVSLCVYIHFLSSVSIGMYMLTYVMNNRNITTFWYIVLGISLTYQITRSNPRICACASSSSVDYSLFNLVSIVIYSSCFSC